MGSTPEAPEAQTPKQVMTEDEKALKTKLTGISNQYADIYNKQYPAYEQYAQSGISNLGRRLETGQQFEQQASELLPKVSVLSPEFQKNLNSTITAKQQQAQTTLSDIYDPLSKQTNAKIYSQLGGVNSSIAGDILGKLEKQKLATAQNLAQGIEADRNAYEQQQLANQQSVLQQLLTGSDYYTNLGLSGLTGATNIGSSVLDSGLSGTTSLNNNAINLANSINAANQQNYQNELSRYNNSWSSLLSPNGLSSAAGSFAKAFVGGGII